MDKYEIEAIEASRWNRGEPKYLVKYKDQPRSENTWESVEKLSSYRHLIAQHLSATNMGGNVERSDADTETQETFICERVEGKRVTNGKIEYFLRWQGYPASENTWEPEEEVSAQLIGPYVASMATKKITEDKQKPKKRSTAGGSKQKATNGDGEDSRIFGFARNLQPLKVHKVIILYGELYFLMQWNGCNLLDLVTAKEAHEKCPQLVIKYFESRICWVNSDGKCHLRVSE